MAHSIWTATTTALIIALIATAGRADDSHIVLYNQIDNCKSNEYFDANYFMCRLCDPQLYLVPSENGKAYAWSLRAHQTHTHTHIYPFLITI